MGNVTSLELFPPAHVRIYKNLLSIQSPQTRAEMIQTLLQAPEYVMSFRQAGIYADLLQYVSRVSRGEPPNVLPGELQAPARQQQQQQQQQQQNITVYSQTQMNPYERIMKGKSNEKALTYFQTCLQVLGLEEEVALTDDELKKAYKKAAIKAHPDKRGGSEQQFEAVTRAYAYLTEILGRIHGGRKAGLKKVEEPNLLKTERTEEASQWKHVEPVRFNPDKLDLSAFNKMFEQTRVPEPDEDGYGDWLKNQSETNAPKFSGKFNRDVFNSMFEEEAAKNRQSNTQLAVAQPQALMFNPSSGVELGRDKPSDFTAPANSDQGLGYTDLRAAYTTENTFSGQVANVRVDARDFGSYQESRKRAPDPLRNEELAALSHMEKEAEEREKRRQLRAAQEIVASDEYRERMKRLVLTDGVPVDKRNRR
jgi:curved DNA-binding protein CbpA